ncbi:MAG: SDR family NAD(P)-dependent oxidoreductase, partial [Candidatus Hodarchaeota archaeon]
MSVQEKLRIVITGGSSGIGEAIALEMAKSKHKFYLTGRNEGRLQKVAEKVKRLGGDAHFGVGNVGDEKDTEKLFEAVLKTLGGVDVLVANAGVGYFGLLEELT